MNYTAPLKDMLFTLSHFAKLPTLLELPRYEDLDIETVEALLEQSAALCNEVVASTNQNGDTQGVSYQDKTVTCADGFKEAYQQWAESGWNGIAAPEKFGGAGLPLALGTATMEMLTSANMALGMGPVLSQGAVDTLLEHANDELAAGYLEKLITGEWMATMNITEPNAGSDLSTITTKADIQEDGSYKITGQKIFISYGEHDLTDNIIHLVLARRPDAPAGNRGLSLFLCPKILNDGTRNDLYCSGVEHKLGIHGSPTCSMSFGDNGGATAWLIGKENEGLKCMFTMMNRARLATGLQGVAIGERAFQQAWIYSGERKQGNDPKTKEKTLIRNHPDVQRMLLRMRTLTMASRALAYYTSYYIDCGEHDKNQSAQARADLLTPIVKAWSTDIGFEIASLGIQVHGGYGFIEETGAAQHMRDIRIASIYEGTNAIQAMDLVNRKVRMTGGEPVKALIQEWREDSTALNNEQTALLNHSLDLLEDATAWVLSDERHPKELATTPHHYLQLFGEIAGHAMLAKAVVAAQSTLQSDTDYQEQWSAMLDFYATHIAAQAQSNLATLKQGATTVSLVGLPN